MYRKCYKSKFYSYFSEWKFYRANIKIYDNKKNNYIFVCSKQYKCTGSIILDYIKQKGEYVIFLDDDDFFSENIMSEINEMLSLYYYFIIYLYFEKK